jgi:hypothetical protein
MLGLEVEASNYYSKTETDNLFTPITSFDDHEKRNVASFALIETELFRVAKEVVLNFNGILINEDAIKENTKAIEDKASLSNENTFNGKQTFNKNVTFKGAETTIIPTLSSRWHKYSVFPPKNAEGQSDTSEAYGVNFWLDAGNTWKNQFKISNRNGTAFEVRGGGGLEGQLHSKWSYTGVQTEDNHIATVKYVKTVVDGIEISEPDLSDYMTAEETADFVDSMDKTYLVQANTKARELDQAYAVPLDGNTTKTGSMTLKTGAATPFEIQAADGSSIFKMWSSGAVALEKPYTGFKDNELVTKAYVDGKVAEGGSGGSGFTAGDQVAKTNGESTNVGGFWISNGNLYCKVS